jgi:MOSC domain-containing protein YiiM
MAKIIAVCRSEQKGIKKEVVDNITIRKNYGVVGDAHADSKTYRQVSLLAIESIQKMQNLGLYVDCGDFAENITTEGIDLVSLPIGTRLHIGKVILELTQKGKECHVGCAIFREVGKCIMPKEGMFAKAIQGGRIEAGDGINVTH